MVEKRIEEDKSNHPWSVFLEARANVIDWMTQRGDSDNQISNYLSMDEMQVYLIRNRNR